MPVHDFVRVGGSGHVAGHTRLKKSPASMGHIVASTRVRHLSQDKSEAKAKKATKQGVILDLTHKSTMDSSAERRGNRITESVQGHRFPVEYRRPPAAVPRDPQIYAPELLEANASLRLVDR